MPIRRRLGTGLTALTAIALLVAGCSDDPEPKFTDDTPTPTSTPTTGDPTESTSTDPTETETSVDPSVEPEYPEEADGKGKKAAKAFIDYYFALIDYSELNGDTKALRRFTGGCRACLTIADKIDALESEGTRTVGVRRSVEISNVGMARYKGEIVASVDLVFKTSEHTVVAADGRTNDRPADTSKVYLIAVRPGSPDGRWRVSDLGSNT